MPQKSQQAETTQAATTPIIAIVGRPNVGKSTLFNRLVGSRHAITSDIAGTTRDRIYYRTEIGHFPVILVDTGGLEYGKKENIEADVQAQVDIAIDQADLIFFVVDAKDGLTIEDDLAAKKLRKAGKPMIFIANKTDHNNAQANLAEMLQFGFGEPIGISAYHDRNIGEIIDTTESTLKELNFKPPYKPSQEESEFPEDRKKSQEAIISRINRRIKEQEGKPIKICFVGKPNVGKSSLVNALLGREKVIVSDIAGTTRDAIDTDITWQEQPFTLIDTAGLRRRGKIERGLEKISTIKALHAIERADIVCLVMDYYEGIRKQDQHISSYIQEAGKGLILAINKSDLMEEKEAERNRMLNVIRRKFDFLPWAPAIFISALHQKNIEKIFEVAQQIHQERFKYIDPDELTIFMEDIIRKHVPPRQHGTIPRFYQLEQDAVDPPCFAYYVNDPTAIHFSYRRYLENELRKRYGFNGTTIKLYFKKKGK